MDLLVETVKFTFPAYFGLETREKCLIFERQRENHIFHAFLTQNTREKCNFTVEIKANPPFSLTSANPSKNVVFFN